MTRFSPSKRGISFLPPRGRTHSIRPLLYFKVLTFCCHAHPIGVDAPFKLSDHREPSRKCGNLGLAFANVPVVAVSIFTAIEVGANSSAAS